ncbi:hypothetical protein AB0E63_42115 [Kribbella sp. NPDC026596]|uniref:hypothetical protein n=1 Tax=Kribbella sp. NPDC026596 TaxID=3155122 RepID=UPI0033EA2968
MADTDDEQTIALEPDQHVQGDDDTEAAGERRGARAWERDGERPDAVAGLTPEEEASRRQEELDEVHDEEDLAQARTEAIELDALDERQLEELRLRREVIAAAETTEAIRLSEASRELRRDGDAKTRQAMSDWSHGHHQLDEAAARPDEPGAAAQAAYGRRYQRAAVREDRSAEADYERADQYDAEARERRGVAQQEQPPAAEAVRNRPAETPQARKFVNKNLKKVRKVRDRSTEPDLEIGG